MKKRKNVGKRISIFTIILAFICAISIVIAFHSLISKKEENGLKVKTSSTTDKDKYQKFFYDNGWDKAIIGEIKEDVPIPAGFNYVSGSKNTGLLVEDPATSQKMMWIPYDETVQMEGIDEYYANTSYDSIDYASYKNMTKYGGFYCLLANENEFESLKQIDQATYNNAKEKAKSFYAENEMVHSHLVYKTEIEQILAFAKKTGINITTTGMQGEEAKVQVDKLLSTSTVSQVDNREVKLSPVVVNMEVDSYLGRDEDALNQDNWYIYETPIIIHTPSGKELSVPVPLGFDVEVQDNVVTITTQGEYHLSYVWIPVDEELNTKDFSEEGIQELNKNLKDAYQIADRTQEEIVDYVKDPTDNIEFQVLQRSIKQYGGFYMGQAELGFDNETEFNNQVRGLNYLKDENTGEVQTYAKNGDYYRTVSAQTVKENTNQNSANYQNSALEKDQEGGYTLTYDKAKELAKKANEESVSTSSNLVYGAQWNAALLWMMKTGKVQMEDIVVDSQELPGAKYQKTNWERETEQLKTINGLYGIAGNLSDLTQETYNENNKNGAIQTATTSQDTYYIGRGGNYGTTGQEKTASGYQIIQKEDAQQDVFGIRDSLILHVGTMDDEVLSQESENVSKSGDQSTTAEYTGWNIRDRFLEDLPDYTSNDDLLYGNGKALLIADLVHSWYTRHGAKYNSNVIKYVPGDSTYTDCSHFMSVVLYEYGHQDPFTYSGCTINKAADWAGPSAQYVTGDFENMVDWTSGDNADYQSGPRDYFCMNGVEIIDRTRWEEETRPGDMLLMYNGDHIQMYAGNNKWYNAGMNRYISESKSNGLAAPYTDDGKLNPKKNPWTWNKGIRLVGSDWISYGRMKALFGMYNSQGWQKSAYHIGRVKDRWGDDQAVLFVLKNFEQSRGLTGGQYRTYIDRCTN